MISVHPGKFLFEFYSQQDWVNRAKVLFKTSDYRSDNTICVDKLGRLCAWGRHFMVAQDSDAYPIRVFVMREDEE